MKKTSKVQKFELFEQEYNSFTDNVVNELSEIKITDDDWKTDKLKININRPKGQKSKEYEKFY